MVMFGYFGDGNLYYNVQMFEGGDVKVFFVVFQVLINWIVYDNVYCYYGMISVEYGIGQLKIDDV